MQKIVFTGWDEFTKLTKVLPLVSFLTLRIYMKGVINGMIYSTFTVDEPESSCVSVKMLLTNSWPEYNTKRDIRT